MKILSWLWGVQLTQVQIAGRIIPKSFYSWSHTRNTKSRPRHLLHTSKMGWRLQQKVRGLFFCLMIGKPKGAKSYCAESKDNLVICLLSLVTIVCESSADLTCDSRKCSFCLLSKFSWYEKLNFALSYFTFIYYILTWSKNKKQIIWWYWTVD